MCWPRCRVPQDAPLWRVGKTQPCRTRELTSWANQVGRRARTDTISSSSEAATWSAVSGSLRGLSPVRAMPGPARHRQRPVEGRSVARPAHVGTRPSVRPASSDGCGRTSDRPRAWAPGWSDRTHWPRRRREARWSRRVDLPDLRPISAPRAHGCQSAPRRVGHRHHDRLTEASRAAQAGTALESLQRGCPSAAVLWQPTAIPPATRWRAPELVWRGSAQSQLLTGRRMSMFLTLFKGPLTPARINATALTFPRKLWLTFQVAHHRSATGPAASVPWPLPPAPSP